MQGFFENFLSDAVVALIGGLIGFLIPRFRRWRLLRKFKRAFGRNVHDAGDMFFSIPLWSLKERARSVKRFMRVDPSGGTEGFYGPSHTFARDDVLGAVYISEMMARRFSKPIKFLSDDSKIENETWSKRSAVIIGSPLANYHARGVIRTYERFAPDELLLSFIEMEENDDSGARLKIVDSATKEEFVSSGSEDYAYILRLNNRYGDEEQGYVFLVGGIHAEGTQAASIFLADCWRAFAKSDGAAAVLLYLQRNQPETVKVLRSYNLPSFESTKVSERQGSGKVGTFAIDRPRLRE